MAPSTPTAPHFPRFDPPIDSRSPSRSPRRKAQFAIKELDPLLGNLSPDSTLKALQATETIPGGAAQDALTSSIRDATPAEREVGIRAAFAAQKLREWNNELSQWQWPDKRERGLGMGFVSPENKETDTEYLGFLLISSVAQYEERLEDIRDDLDSLGIDDIKDHVLEAHVPTKELSKTKALGIRTNDGKLRDFTALITATVIQALPDLAKLNMLLDTWDIRLRVLRDLPGFLEVMESTQSGIQAAFQEIRDPELARNATEASFDSKKVALGGQVSDMGRRVDRFLDMLEGYEDSLPQAWIDRLEKIELDYATWVVEAQHVALRNKLALTVRENPETTSEPISLPTTQTQNEGKNQTENKQPEPTESRMEPDPGLLESKSELSEAKPEELHPKRKPSLKLHLSDQRTHRREISKVSIADSTFSGFSDISNAEIMDATSASVLPSPKISVVDNPLRTSRHEITWFGNASAAQHHMATKPPMLQRASTASIEVFPKDKLKRVMLRRTASWDMLSQIPQSPDSTPSKALMQLTGADSPIARASMVELEGSQPPLPPLAQPENERSRLSTSAKAEPSPVPSKEDSPPIPALPRRSSKRNMLNANSPFSPLASVSSIGAGTKEDSSEQQPLLKPPTPIEQSSPKAIKIGESLDDKIQDILTTLPTKIRLAKDGDSSNSTRSSSASSTRASTPTPALTLSPARSEPSSRKSSLGGPEVRVYHLTRTGQARDVPPVKLFVRTVGDGRVMVRVGGGWADLGEYLREYNLHHGSRTAGDGRLEVASFPGNGQKDPSGVNCGSGTSGYQGRRKSRSPSATQTSFEINSSPDLVNPRARPRCRSPEPGKSMRKEDGAWTPPPVPPIPASYTTKSPTIMMATQSDVGSATGVVDADRASQPFRDSETPFNPRSSTISSPGVTATTTTVTPPIATTNYTPLGAAGPKTNARRAVTFGTTPSTNNDAWVEGMVGKARAVSGGSPTMVQGPTTTTTVTSTTPTSRRMPYFSPSPNTNSSPTTISPSTSVASRTSDANNRRVSLTARPKSRMSLSDIGGIKRVFLRRKSENVK
ncbi:uncharacterized protein Z518_01649 [Rhinocladiella mackenziei CBS 650.93]|uniref:GAR domain-containing protein n=1 Tax=Rhinocladiella mackenziei CBS 650.93 TaxID=1442369 RepID=A0A0D2JM93_9EURO|nr:uncharacterized protein Z518_01649 [Rhinocladiella mackenziei CBS 650.93]KIX10565.1 hypothetical protein Z518_01649 [Rhinocladiella mackenziei CBS 650.93]